MNAVQHVCKDPQGRAWDWVWSIKFHIWEQKDRNGPEEHCDVANIALGTPLFHSRNNHVRCSVCLAFCHRLVMQKG